MAAQLSAGIRKLFQEPNIAFFSTLMPDGSPQVTPVWVDIEDDHILINSAEGRQKPRNVRRDPRIAIAIISPDNPYARATIRGRVIEVTHDGADELINKLSKKYIGQDPYPWGEPGQVRVTFKIEPEHIASKMID